VGCGSLLRFLSNLDLLGRGRQLLLLAHALQLIVDLLGRLDSVG
jgi:hypothetical protein